MADDERAALQAKIVALNARLIVTIERSEARLRKSQQRIKRTDERLGGSASTSLHLPSRAGDGLHENQ